MRKRTRGHDLAGLRRLNTTVILRALHRRSPQTLAELAAGTGLSRPTVEAVLEDLVARAWVTEAAAGERARGRPARRFRFRSEAGHVLGADIGLHKMVLLLADLGGTVLAAERADIDPLLGGGPRLALLQRAMDAFLDAHAVRRDTVLARCVGVPGVVDAGGHLTSVVVPEWSGVDLRRLLSDGETGHTLVENDVNLAVLAERWQGAATLAGDVVCVLTGHRVSCALTIGGRLHRGGRGGAGELGLLPLLGLDTAQEALAWPGPRRPGESEVAALARAADAGEARALAALADFAERLAPGIAALALAVDPELIVLTGGATPLGTHLVPPLEARLRPLTLHLPRIAVSSLGERGVALGAVRKALDLVEEELLADTAD
ncbi:ROK family transcriptional regulator [Streptomyces spectabilis]|uniref:Putative NBD/HSP70 family sugar kinase n=2 Tax=Streptomyces spectabilis TaxID=68270 RepID=A0A5P2XL10_STRST|nr:ROK family transcriptional regulator [Streptomyces spectabilis]MBB5106924.1 putative NBD/HSP70 family sugar kinase [Streptomyces spectabilis]MCI3906346.1 ROK family protein [Streptomyces spectabilis]QEV63206.1 ROK family transcriptional regulator [Streptomyces spectabilis]GGV41254.1 transcriptional regulator [Streptomyces spectabilis]